MARNETLTLQADTWVQLTNADVDRIRVFNRSAYDVEMTVTAGATPPSNDFLTDIKLATGATLAADLSLADIWPGVFGANRVWARVFNTGVTITLSVSHA